MTKTYIVDILRVLKTNGIACSNPTILPQKPDCANIVCELIRDANGNVRSMKVQVPDECPDGCIDVIFDCSEQCSSCGQQRLSICPCTENGDCPDCMDCGPGKYCVSTCKAGEFCSGDKCVECDDTKPCPNGQICFGGKCECPPDKPWKNSKGECVQCSSETPLTACQDCVDGFIVVKDCAVGVLNPDTCKCVECVKSSDCKKPNEKCGPDGCECIEGFKRNLTTGDCEVAPDCERDEDCGGCRKCLASGKCGDFNCPPGFTPSNIPGNCCVKLCDCNNPSCPPGHKCTSLDGTLCFCQDCNVKCNNGKCPEGCECKDGENCGTNPCSGKCNNSVPCAPECGCDEQQNCVPCESLKCAQCEQTTNCKCTTPDNCTTSDCFGPCDENNPCPGPDCGCNDSHICENCSKISCDVDTDCPQGCDCKDNNRCGKTPCANTYCTNPSECGEGCDCVKGKCQTGGGGGNGDGQCNDIITITKNNDCSLTGVLNTQDCCECREIYVHGNQTTTAGSKAIIATLRTGPNVGDPLLSATGIAGDDSVSGQIRYSWEQTAKECNASGTVIPGGSQIILSSNMVLTYVNTDTAADSIFSKSNGTVFIQSGKQYKVTETTMYVESIGLLTNAFSKCTYRIGKTLLYRKSSADSGNYVAMLDRVQRCKNPIFHWYKSLNGSTWTLFRRAYSTFSGGTYKDTVNNANGLELCDYIKVDPDCGCAEEKKYSCNGVTATKYEPHKPETLDITQTDPCGRTIVIDEVAVCDVYKTTSLPYKLYINGVFEADYNVDASNILFAGGLTITKLVPIKQVKLVYPCDDCNEPLIIDLPVLSADCFVCTDATLNMAVAGNCAGITVSGSLMNYTNPLIAVPGCEIKVYANNVLKGTAITDVNGLYLFTFPAVANGTFAIKVVNCLGCEATGSIVISDCCDAVLNAVSYNCATQTITSTITSCPGPLGYNILQNNVIIFSGLYLPSIVLPFALVNGNYTLQVDCGGGCLASKDFSVSCGLPDFTFTNTCIGLIGQITINAFSGGSGAPYLFEYSTDNFSSILGSSAIAPFTFNTTAGTTYQMRVKDSAGNSSSVKISTGLDCSINSFDFTAIMKCISGVQKFCFTPTISGVFTAVVKDFNNVTVFSGPISGTANVEVCTNFTTPPAAGIGSIDLTYNGNLVTKPITIAACAVAAISYDCVTGLSVTGVTSFMVHSTGYPPSGYGPYNSGDPNLFFTDDLTGSRTLTIKSIDGLETYGTVVINCCVHSFTPQDDICDGSTAKVKILLVGAAGNYSATVLDGLSTYCAPQNIVHPGGTATYNLACPLVSNTTYNIQVENLTYGSKFYKDNLTGNTKCIVTKAYTSTNCGGTGGGGGTGSCNLTQGDFVITGGCNPVITNNSIKTVSFYFYSTQNTDCTGFGFIEGTPVTINAGQTVSYGGLGNPNLGKKVFINYLGTGVSDPCTLSFCYTGCTGGLSCVLPTPPVASCSFTGFGPTRTLTVLNNNSKAVFWSVNGVDKGIINPGFTGTAFYPNGSVLEILFKCIDDISVTTSLTYTLTC